MKRSPTSPSKITPQPKPAPRSPAAPPVYRPQPLPKVLQTKQRAANQPAPKVQGNQPVSKVLQRANVGPARKPGNSTIQLAERALRRLAMIRGHLVGGPPAPAPAPPSPSPAPLAPSDANWTVASSPPNGFRIGVFVTSAANDVHLQNGWKSRAQLAAEGHKVVFVGSRLSEGQYFVLDQDPNAKRAIDFYKQQIAKGSADPEVRVSYYGVYWVREEGPKSFDITPPKGKEWEMEGNVFYQVPPHPAVEQASQLFDAIIEDRSNYSSKGPEHSYRVLEGKINPRAIKNLVIVKERDEVVKNPRSVVI